MKTIRNKTHKPIKVPLPRGKVLHLSPNHEGQISDHAVDHPPLKKLVEAGEIEILGQGEQASGAGDKGSMPHESTHGHTQKQVSHNLGNR